MNECIRELPERINPAGMARTLNISRARLYQLIKDGTFPAASRDDQDRPFFTREQQRQILDLYRNNRGMDGRSVFFRPRSTRTPPPSRPKRHAGPQSEDHTALLSSIRAMGLSHVRKSDVQKCLSELFPHGRIPEDKAALVRQVFVHLHRQDSGDMQGR
jgi:hypothetical protein